MCFLIDLPYATLSKAPKDVFRNRQFGLRQFCVSDRREKQPLEVVWREKKSVEDKYFWHDRNPAKLYF